MLPAKVPVLLRWRAPRDALRGPNPADGDEGVEGGREDEGRRRPSMLLAGDPPRPRRVLGGTLEHRLCLGTERKVAWWDRLIPLSPFPSAWSPETPLTSSYEQKFAGKLNSEVGDIGR